MADLDDPDAHVDVFLCLPLPWLAATDGDGLVVPGCRIGGPLDGVLNLGMVFLTAAKAERHAVVCRPEEAVIQPLDGHDLVHFAHDLFVFDHDPNHDLAI